MPRYVLIADDDPEMVSLLSMRLEAEGCFTTHAVDAMQAWVQIETMDPILVVLDLNMPGVWSGADVMRKIRGHHRRFDTPVIILTGVDLDRARKLVGKDDRRTRVLNKPLDWDLFMKTFREMMISWLQDHAASRES
ncbi:MAG: hypothetical protein A2X36_04220 [Elusimicrobia bacterium GWA2_69_24]|nr:MAG: hypothetical protein A2X36_04220 [Elusimicrobia bacterium GWA2_69_24]HBL16147.1 hypothetical protein [Elusimicrobiota bacterium]